jgi:hypothetical protein
MHAYKKQSKETRTEVTVSNTPVSQILFMNFEAGGRLFHQSPNCKRLRSPGIDSNESFPPAYEAWRAGKSNMVIGPPGWESIPRLLKSLRNSGSGSTSAEGYSLFSLLL